MKRLLPLLFFLLICSSAFAGGVVTGGGSDAALRVEFDGHVVDISTHGCTTIASKTYVDDTFFTIASATLDAAFTTQSIATHSLLSDTHNCTSIASEAFVTDYAHPLGGSTTIDLLTRRVDGTNASFTDNLQAGYFIGDGSLLTNLPSSGTQSGNEVLIDTATTSYPLPIVNADTTYTIASGAVVMAEYWVSLQASATLLVYTARLNCTMSKFDNVLNIVGSETLFFNRLNANAVSVIIDDSGRVVASAPANVRAKVTKTEYTTMGGD